MKTTYTAVEWDENLRIVDHCGHKHRTKEKMLECARNKLHGLWQKYDDPYFGFIERIDNDNDFRYFVYDETKSNVNELDCVKTVFSEQTVNQTLEEFEEDLDSNEHDDKPYRLYLTIHNSRNHSSILDVVEEMMGRMDWWERSDSTITTAVDFDLENVHEEEEMAKELTTRIWQANGEYCRVIIDTIANNSYDEDEEECNYEFNVTDFDEFYVVGGKVIDKVVNWQKEGF